MAYKSYLFFYWNRSLEFIHIVLNIFMLCILNWELKDMLHIRF